MLRAWTKAVSVTVNKTGWIPESFLESNCENLLIREREKSRMVLWLLVKDLSYSTKTRNTGKSTDLGRQGEGEMVREERSKMLL